MPGVTDQPQQALTGSVSACTPLDRHGDVCFAEVTSTCEIASSPHAGVEQMTPQADARLRAVLAEQTLLPTATGGVEKPSRGAS